MRPISVFEMFKVGVGPSSSHTMGPWRAAQTFLQEMPEATRARITNILVELYGSLAKTGRGHGTDIAIQLGLSGESPETIPVESIHTRVQDIAGSKRIRLGGQREIEFDPTTCIKFHTDQQLDYHPNGMRFSARLGQAENYEAVFYSVGGGFVVRENETPELAVGDLPYPMDTASQMLEHCAGRHSNIAAIVRHNERFWRSDQEIDAGLEELESTMLNSVHRGCRAGGILPGGLGVRRRAAAMATKLLGQECSPSIEQWLARLRNQDHDFRHVLDWVSCFALAVNEENAAFGRVVTAPTNGSAGVIPAVLLYAICFCGITTKQARDFLLTAGQIGCLFKQGATISAAQGGCQAEIGVSSAMAAAALAETLGCTPAQSAEAAEIAMEHHLGLTCDPVGGLVQIPCIERNAMGAIKAITSAELALQRPAADCRVSLDTVIKTMWQTAQDMDAKYKETSEGGLASQISVNLSEC